MAFIRQFRGIVSILLSVVLIFWNTSCKHKRSADRMDVADKSEEIPSAADPDDVFLPYGYDLSEVKTFYFIDDRPDGLELSEDDLNYMIIGTLGAAAVFGLGVGAYKWLGTNSKGSADIAPVKPRSSDDLPSSDADFSKTRTAAEDTAGTSAAKSGDAETGVNANQAEKEVVMEPSSDGNNEVVTEAGVTEVVKTQDEVKFSPDEAMVVVSVPADSSAGRDLIPEIQRAELEETGTTSAVSTKMGDQDVTVQALAVENGIMLAAARRQNAEPDGLLSKMKTIDEHLKNLKKTDEQPSGKTRSDKNITTKTENFLTKEKIQGIERELDLLTKERQQFLKDEAKLKSDRKDLTDRYRDIKKRTAELYKQSVRGGKATEVNAQLNQMKNKTMKKELKSEFSALDTMYKRYIVDIKKKNEESSRLQKKDKDLRKNTDLIYHQALYPASKNPATGKNQVSKATKKK
ncbi:MAG: hypothetical protein H6618_05615 [Deltaproteobacteria bacterium]|nr:hypothetical protein [Deltaproteobacteria bacterium]